MKSDKKVSDPRALRLALVGSETLLGREIKDVLESSDTPVVTDDFAANGEGSFGEEDGEALYRQPLGMDALASAELVVLAGTEEGSQKAYNLSKAQPNPRRLIDCTGQLDQEPEARICSPLLSDDAPPSGWLQIIAHPAATAIALILGRLSKKHRIERALFDIFEPASERGGRGIAELQQQTTSLLSFRPLDKQVFDAQLSFNLLPGYGEQAPFKLESVEHRIETHLATLLARNTGGGTPVSIPSLRVIQAPVFHGYSCSAWIQFGANVDAESVAHALASAQIEIRSSGDEWPTNVGAAGQSGLIVGDIRVDRNNAKAVWLWVVFDNLRLRADSLTELLSARESE